MQSEPRLYSSILSKFKSSLFFGYFVEMFNLKPPFATHFHGVVFNYVTGVRFSKVPKLFERISGS